MKANSLVVDTYFLGILEAVTAGVTSGTPLPLPATVMREFVPVTPKPPRNAASLPEKLQVNPDGSWNVVVDSALDLDEDDAPPPVKRQAVEGAAALVRAESASGPAPSPSGPAPSSNGFVRPAAPVAAPRAAGGAGAEADVIDLLSSDDDD